MKKTALNTIIFGPAGTGKTRAMVQLATKIATENKEVLKDVKFDTLANRPNLNIKNLDLMEEIKDLTKDVSAILSNLSHKGHLESLDHPRERIMEYRAFPLIEMVTFHPSYSYQDFVEGLMPEATGGKTSQITYNVKDGIFKNICERALQNPQFNYVLIIDEINRGNISSIFGELFTLLEPDKRKGKANELSINLPYSKDKQQNPKKLIVPDNLYLVATMNTVDKSIALIDVALRRRFDFMELLPDYDVLKEVEAEDGIKLDLVLKAMNDRITVLKNEHYQIGHSYFLPVGFGEENKKMSMTEIKSIFINKIIPLLQEFHYDDWKSICAVLNQSSRENGMGADFMLTKVIAHDKTFLSEYADIATSRNTATYKVNRDFSAAAVKRIYSGEQR